MNLILEIYREILQIYEKCKTLNGNKSSIEKDISLDVHKCNLLAHLYFIQSIVYTEFEFYKTTGIHIKDLNDDIHTFCVLRYPDVRYMNIEMVNSVLKE